MWLWRVVLAVRCAAFTLPWVGHLLIVDVLLSALLLVSPIAPDLAFRVSSAIAESVWRGIQIIFTRINRAKIVVSGAENLPRGESAIVISNHVEWADFYMIQELAIKAGMLGRCRWFAKQQLKWVPFLGWGLWVMGFPLVSRRWTKDQREMNRVFHGVLERKWPICKFLKCSEVRRCSLAAVKLVLSIYQGSYLTVRALDSRPRKGRKLNDGATRITRRWANMFYIHARRDSLHLYRSYGRHLI